MKKNNIIILFASFAILVIIWIIGNVYHANATSTISSDLSVQSAPIQATFNEDVLARVRTREQIATFFESSATSSATITSGASSSLPSITPSISPKPTLSAQPASGSAVKK